MQRSVAVVMGASLTVAGAVALLGWGIPPAGAQLGNPGWGGDVDVDEAAGEVVLTLEFGGTGNVKYRTIDETARAPEDYTAVSGEVVFTHPGSRKIRIPIADDTLAEGGYETFAVHAVEEPNPDPWPYAGDTVTVRIIDDDTAEAPTAEAPSSSTSAGSLGQDSQGVNGGSPSTVVEAPSATDGAALTTQTSTTAAAAREPALPELRPGPGFELTSTAAARLSDSQETTREAGGSFPSTMVVSGTAAFASGALALALVKRRCRWSPTRP